MLQYESNLQWMPDLVIQWTDKTRNFRISTFLDTMYKN